MNTEMIDENTGLATTLLWLVLFWLPLTISFWFLIGMFEQVGENMESRSFRRRILRIQKFLFRGKYLTGGPPSPAERLASKHQYRFMRGFVILIWVIMAIKTVQKVIATFG